MNYTNAQVGIGTTTPAEGSLLDIATTDKGILIPRVDITDLSTQAPVTGDLANSESLMVYNTNATTGKGFYYWDGAKWVGVGSDSDTNIYNSDGTLTETRTVNLDEHTLKFDNGAGRYLSLIGASVSDNDAPFLFTTGNAVQFDIDNLPVLTLDADKQVGIGLNDPLAALHIYEANGTAVSATTGTLLLEHGNAGGESSILFKSAQDNTDYGYIKFSEDGSGNGSTTENSLMEIGVQNDTSGTNQDDINIASSGNVGISNTAPKEKLHISGNNSTIRIDGMNTANNTTNVAGDPMPVYVDDDGKMVLQPSLVQTYMPVNLNDFLQEVEIRSSNGSGVISELYSTTITLTQESLVEIIYQMGVGITTYNRLPVTDGAARLYRSWFTVNVGTRLGLDTGTYTNNPDDSDPNRDGVSTFASGLYFLAGSGYAQLPAGTHTIRVFGLGFGGEFGYTMTYGGGNGDNIQIIVHR